MDVKEFARLGGKARAKALGPDGLKAHAAKMVAARKSNQALREYVAKLRCPMQCNGLYHVEDCPRLLANLGREAIDTVDNQRQPTSPDIGTTEQR